MSCGRVPTTLAMRIDERVAGALPGRALSPVAWHPDAVVLDAGREAARSRRLLRPSKTTRGSGNQPESSSRQPVGGLGHDRPRRRAGSPQVQGVAPTALDLAGVEQRVVGQDAGAVELRSRSISGIARE